MRGNFGGAVGGLGGSFHLTRVSLAGNHALFIAGFDGTGTIEDSTIAGNEGDAVGGGLVDRGHVTVRRSTVSGNVGDRVGGLTVSADTRTPASLTLEASTVVGNVPSAPDAAATDLALVRLGAGSGPVSAMLQGSIIGDPGAGAGACDIADGTVTSLGGNVVSDDSCGIGDGPGDRPAVGDPLLAPLADDGGPTLTRAPRVGSPAQDVVPIGAPGCPGLDQRGVAIPIGPACDAGAVEGDKGGYHPLPGTRLLDTRSPFDHPVGPAQVRVLDVTGVGGVPDVGASAVVVNVTAVNATSASHLTVWPAGRLLPDTSTVNFPAGSTTANLATVQVGAGGGIAIRNNAGDTDVLVDVVGWFDDAADASLGDCPCGGAYTGLTPVRVLDTRTGIGSAGAFGGGEAREVQVAGTAGVPLGADAVIVNLTAESASEPTHLVAWTPGQPVPDVSHLNIGPQRTVANLMIVRPDTDGDLALRNNSGAVQVLMDVVGWFDEGAGPRFTPQTPVRLLDTRSGLGLVGPFGPGQTRSSPFASSPAVVGTVANVTVESASAPSHLTVWPAGRPLPNASNTNFGPNQTVANLAVTRLGADGAVAIRNNSGTVHVIADVSGYFS